VFGLIQSKGVLRNKSNQSFQKANSNPTVSWLITHFITHRFKLALDITWWLTLRVLDGKRWLHDLD